MPEMVFIILGWFAGGFINGFVGFGAAIIAMPLIAQFIDLSLAVPSCTLIILTLNLQMSWTFRKFIEWSYLKGIFIGSIPGVVLSIFILEYFSENSLKAGMGSFIACYGLFSLYEEIRGNNGERKINTAWGYVSGLFSTTLGMAFGFNGPPLAAYIANSGCKAKSVKGLLGAGFVITGVFIVSAKAMTGQITEPVMLIYAVAVPSVILGNKLGIWLSADVNEKSYRKILFLALIGMGLNIFWNALS